MADTTLKSPKIYWPAVMQSDIGPIEAYSITVPVEFNGILEVYKIPACDDYPEGIWAALTSELSDSNTIEPGCESYLKTHLLRVRLTGIPGTDDATGGGTQNEVYYQYPDLPINISQLNPNVWETPEVPEAVEGE